MFLSLTQHPCQSERATVGLPFGGNLLNAFQQRDINRKVPCREPREATPQIGLVEGVFRADRTG